MRSNKRRASRVGLLGKLGIAAVLTSTALVSGASPVQASMTGPAAQRSAGAKLPPPSEMPPSFLSTGTKSASTSTSSLSTATATGVASIPYWGVNFERTPRGPASLGGDGQPDCSSTSMPSAPQPCTNGMENPNLTAQLQIMYGNTGIRVLRWPFRWQLVQPTGTSSITGCTQTDPGTCHWGTYDSLMASAAKAGTPWGTTGLSVLPIIVDAPAWANTPGLANGVCSASPAAAGIHGCDHPPNTSSTNTMQAWEAFAAGVALRYEPNGGGFWSTVRPDLSQYQNVTGTTAYEIWNEPNLYGQFWDDGNEAMYQGQPDFNGYITLGGEVSAVENDAAYWIHYFQPSARLIAGALSYQPCNYFNAECDSAEKVDTNDFLDDIFQWGVSSYFTDYGFHPYAPLPDGNSNTTSAPNYDVKTGTTHSSCPSGSGEFGWSTDLAASAWTDTCYIRTFRARLDGEPAATGSRAGSGMHIAITETGFASATPCPGGSCSYPNGRAYTTQEGCATSPCPSQLSKLNAEADALVKYRGPVASGTSEGWDTSTAIIYNWADTGSAGFWGDYTGLEHSSLTTKPVLTQTYSYTGYSQLLPTYLAGHP